MGTFQNFKDPNQSKDEKTRAKFPASPHIKSQYGFQSDEPSLWGNLQKGQTVVRGDKIARYKNVSP